MGKIIRLKKGFTIKLAGKASPKIEETDQAETFVIKPTDFQGLYMPKVVVKEGDTVKAGTPLFHDKKLENVVHTSPVSGEIVEIKRGEKRKLLEVKVLADKKVEYEHFKKYSLSDITHLQVEEAKEQLLKSGVWVNIVQRPYGVVADPEVSPKAIHISTFDSHPLAPDYGLLLKGEEQHFQTGLDVLKKFTSGPVHLNIHTDTEISSLFSQARGIEMNKFAGQHPAGCVGVQIHHIDPINKNDVVWTISPVGVVQIGKLFLHGIYDASRIVALTGSEVKEPRHFKTYTGASIKKFIENNIKSDHCRFISGNVLTGTTIGKDGHVGFFDNQITVIPEGDHYEFIGWILPTVKKVSFHRAFGLLSFLAPGREFKMDSNTHGEPRAFVMTGVFEKVLPMDILPTQLLKSILAEDIDEMEALGIYEVVEEDLALCEFVDVSKHNIQEILREGIELIRNS